MMRVLFMGTGEIALPSFLMVAEEFELVGLVTQPDKPVGRSGKLRPPRIKTLALEKGLPVLQPEKLRRRNSWGEIVGLYPQAIVVMAYGQILPPRLLEMPPFGCYNVHASLLPRHRGASCIQAAIDAGDTESGVSVMHMAEGLDTGDVILSSAVTLAPDETGGSLHARLATLSPSVLADALRLIEKGEAQRHRQEEALVTYAPKLGRGDGEISWTREAAAIERRVRAYDPWPGAFTTLRDERGRPKRLKIFPGAEVLAAKGTPGEVLEVGPEGLVVGCGTGALRLTSLQEEGGRRLRAREFLAGHKLRVGDRFFSLEQGEE